MKTKSPALISTSGGNRTQGSFLARRPAAPIYFSWITLGGLGAPLLAGFARGGDFRTYAIFSLLPPSLSQIGRDLIVYVRTPPPEVSFLVARLQYAPVLHHNAHLPCEAITASAPWMPTTLRQP